jgi:hypothetical protein
LKRVGGGRVENMYQEMVYYNWMHVKTRLSQSILSKIVVPRNFFELRVLQKIFQKIFQHFEITLFTQLTSYNYSTLFTLYTLTSAAFKYLTEINSFTHPCHHNDW